jgi:uncharacterized surface protein with fasciclin (FAS1) repeats
MKKYLVALLVLCCFVIAAVVSSSASSADKDIVGTAIAAGNFKTLTAALTEAGLVATLKGPGPFTVFAPTDSAFARIPKADLDKLMKDKDALKKVLLYHVVSGQLMSSDVAKLQVARTAQGGELKIVVKGKEIMVNHALVVKADVQASNGVIHVIDAVLMPPAAKKPAPKK